MSVMLMSVLSPTVALSHHWVALETHRLKQSNGLLLPFGLLDCYSKG